MSSGKRVREEENVEGKGEKERQELSEKSESEKAAIAVLGALKDDNDGDSEEDQETVLKSIPVFIGDL